MRDCAQTCNYDREACEYESLNLNSEMQNGCSKKIEFCYSLCERAEKVV